MTDWRSIPVSSINWRALKPRIGRSAHPLRRLCTPPHDGRVRDFGSGAWAHMTLGEVADLGARVILREPDVGQVTLGALQSVIDMAADGRLPTSASPAPDALRPRNKPETKPEM